MDAQGSREFEIPEVTQQLREKVCEAIEKLSEPNGMSFKFLGSGEQEKLGRFALLGTACLRPKGVRTRASQERDWYIRLGDAEHLYYQDAEGILYNVLVRELITSSGVLTMVQHMLIGCLISRH